MGKYRTITTSVDVDIDLSNLDDDELLEELESRGLDLNTTYVDGDRMREFLTTIWEKRRLGKNFDEELDQMIYHGLGKVI